MNENKKNWVIFGGAIAIVFILGLFASTIMERRAETLVIFKPQVQLRDQESRNEVWGKNFPREYSTYIQTAQTSFKSKYNGNGVVDMLAEDPRLVVLWAGYPFSKDYNQPRGHYYAIEDIRKTLRSGAPKDANDGPLPNTCWTCKSPDVPRIMAAEGIEAAYKGKWASKGHEMVNFIGCNDCHDAKTAALKISRPALIEAYERQGKDIKKATHQEMRSLVCAQCHVEYYFKGDNKYLTFPWDKGYTVDEIEKYYDELNFKDWEHGLSKTPMLKAQHPDFEVAKLGIHAQRGVSCADCHMPYVSEGGVKFTSHHIQSPLNAINKTCQTCHRESEEELKKNVYDRQDKVYEIRIKAEDALAYAHFEAKAAWDAGATEAEMKEILTNIRHAQWRWDWAVAGHGNAFHAPVETLRVLGTALEKAQNARILLARLLTAKGVKFVMPDISTKEKAGKLIGLDYEKMRADKKVFLDTLVKEWDAKAAKRQEEWCTEGNGQTCK